MMKESYDGLSQISCQESTRKQSVAGILWREKSFFHFKLKPTSFNNRLPLKSERLDVFESNGLIVLLCLLSPY